MHRGQKTLELVRVYWEMGFNGGKASQFSWRGLSRWLTAAYKKAGIVGVELSQVLLYHAILGMVGVADPWSTRISSGLLN